MATANGSTTFETDKPLTLVVIMVCIYIFLFIERPWESIRYLQGVPIERVFAIAMIIVAFMHNKFKIVSSPTNKWVYGLLALHFVLSPFAYNTGFAVDQGIEYAKMVILYMLMLSVVDDEATLKVLVKAYVFTMMFYALHSLWEYHNGRYEYRMGISRMVGVDLTFNDPNAFGASVVISVPFVYALLRTETKTLLRRLYYGYFALVVICVVLTGSRSSFVALIFIMMLWVVAQKGKRKLVLLMASILAIGVIWAGMPLEKKERIRSLWDENAGPANAHESAEGRMIGFKASWKMFSQVPFTGVGGGGKNYGGYRYSHQIDGPGNECAMQAHILYGEVLAEFGIGGAILLVGLILSIIRCYMAVRRQVLTMPDEALFPLLLGNAIICGLLLLLFLGFGGHNFYRPMWLWLAAWIGGLYRIYAQKSNQLQNGHVW